MTQLAPKGDLDGSSVGFDQGFFQAAIGKVYDFLSDLVGTDSGVLATVLSKLKVGGPGARRNLAVAFSTAAGAMTVALKEASGGADPSAANPVIIAQRSTSASTGQVLQRAVAAALSLTVPSGATFGLGNSANDYLYIYALDGAAGAQELAMSATDFGAAGIVSTTAISGAATSSTVMYAANARANYPFAALARISAPQAAAGTWAAPPVTVELWPWTDGGAAPVMPVCGRLTASSGVPAWVADVTAAASVYLTPYKGDTLPLWDGVNRFVNTRFTEVSQALNDATKSPAAAANNSNYDMFAWSDAGTFRCTRGPAWTSDTNPGTGVGTTELELFRGYLVNKYAIANGPAARCGLYRGSIRTNGTATVDDTAKIIGVWNYHNRLRRAVKSWFTAGRSTSSTSYTELNTEIRVQGLVGYAEENIELVTSGHFAISTTSNNAAQLSVAINGSTPEDVFTQVSNNNATVYGGPAAVSADRAAFRGWFYATVVAKVPVGTDAVTATGSGTSATRTTLTAKLFA